MKFVLIVVMVFMMLFTALGLFPSFSNFLFARGSDNLMELITSNISVQILFLMLFGFSAFMYIKRRSKLYISLIFISFAFWILSGRMIALFPHGRLSSGWFYFETSRTDICKEDMDCEKIFYYETTFDRLLFWRIKIKNKQIDDIVFTSPFIWEKSINLFKNNFKKSYQNSLSK